MPLDGKPCIRRVHALAVVLHAQEPLAPELHRDGDSGRAGIDRILDELLDDGGRALDDFAGGDLVGEVDGKSVDAAHGQ